MGIETITILIVRCDDCSDAARRAARLGDDDARRWLHDLLARTQRPAVGGKPGLRVRQRVYLSLPYRCSCFMACILERSGVAQDLYRAMHIFAGGLPGGLAVQTTLVAVVMAAMTGIIGGEIVLLGLIALPQMLRLNYDPEACDRHDLRRRLARDNDPAKRRAHPLRADRQCLDQRLCSSPALRRVCCFAASMSATSFFAAG